MSELGYKHGRNHSNYSTDYAFKLGYEALKTKKIIKLREAAT